MTKGSPKIVVRVPQPLLEAVYTAIGNRNAKSAGEPWDMSAFTRAALREKLAKMKRSRSRKVVKR